MVESFKFSFRTDDNKRNEGTSFRSSKV